MNYKIPKKPRSALPLLAIILRKNWLNRILSPLEKATKNNLMVADGAKIITTNKLNEQLLKDFFENRVLAIHIPGFCPPDIAQYTADNALKKEIHNWNVRDVKKGYKQSDVDVFGEPFNMAIKNNVSWIKYFASAKPLSEELKALSAPKEYPLDKFCNEINAIWPKGIITGIYKGAEMVPGLVRVMHDKIQKTADIPLNCHVDTMPILFKNKGQFSVNIYLKPAEEGGNLFVWDTKISGLKEFFSRWYVIKNFFMQSNYLEEDLQRSFQKLLPPPQEIQVKQGDLVLINTGRPHAIGAFKNGPRVSLQAFIKYKKDNPLQLWA